MVKIKLSYYWLLHNLFFFHAGRFQTREKQMEEGFSQVGNKWMIQSHHDKTLTLLDCTINQFVCFFFWSNTNQFVKNTQKNQKKNKNSKPATEHLGSSHMNVIFPGFPFGPSPNPILEMLCTNVVASWLWALPSF